jgi:hypothetical protein
MMQRGGCSYQHFRRRVSPVRRCPQTNLYKIVPIVEQIAETVSAVTGDANAVPVPGQGAQH